MILTAGLSPAWQQILIFDELQPGEVNRAREAWYAASGKVLNAARAVSCLGAEGIAIAPAGGALGEAMSRSLAAEGIRFHAVNSSAPTRTCTTVIDHATSTTTELVENAAAVTPADLERFRTDFRALARSAESGPASVIVLMGSLPAGAPSSFFRELVAGLDARVVADIRGPELLELLDESPLLVKPNRAELARTLGETIDSEDELVAACRRLHERGANWVLITQGAESTFACSRDGAIHRFEPSRVEVVNPIGCGDAMAGGIAVALSEGADVPDACRLGMACAAANLRSLVPGRLDGAAARRRA